MIWMIFLGFNACGSEKSAYQTPVSLDNINKIELSNGIYDDLFVTNNVLQDFTAPLNTAWDWNTILHAEFNGDLLAGNVNFMLSQISKIRCKYREYGFSDWITFDEVSITNVEDLVFERYIRFNKSKTTYDVALVPIFADEQTEGNYNITSVDSYFDGLFVLDKDYSYNAVSVEITPTKNIISGLLTPLDGKYPVVFHNTSINYDSLSVKCQFIQTIDCELNKDGALLYRENAKKFLTNNMPKILKYEDGRIWLADIPDNQVTDDSSQYNFEGYTLTSWNFVEVGDPNSQEDLYENGLIDIAPSYQV